MPAIAARLLLSLCVAGLSLPASALELADGRFTLKGFGTLGAVYNSNAEAQFVRDISQPDGPAGNTSLDTDSRLGLQAGWRLSPEFDLIAQGVARYTPLGNYDPRLTWAFLRYQPNPAVTLRLGRVALDTYMLSDSKDVGYSYLWVRPPVDYYGIRHLSHIDGGDITLRHPLGNGLLWGKLFAGRADEKINSVLEGVVLDASPTRAYGGHINYEQGDWRWQAGMSLFRYRLDVPQAYYNQTAFIGLFDPVLAGLLLDTIADVDLRLYSLGVAYDRGPLQVQVMLGHLDRPGNTLDVSSGFVTLGYRIQPFTPYVTLSGSRTRGYRFEDIGVVTLQGEQGITQQTLSLGLRWDLADNLALKSQLDHVNVEQNSILWRSREDGWNGSATLFSVALDFIF